MPNTQARGWGVICEQSGPKDREQIIPQFLAAKSDRRLVARSTALC